jgi:hypothetical protein
VKTAVAIINAAAVFFVTCSVCYCGAKWLVEKTGPKVPSIPAFTRDPPFWQNARWVVFQFVVFVSSGMLMLSLNDAQVSDDPGRWALSVCIMSGSTAFMATIAANRVLGAFARARARLARGGRARKAGSAPSR